MGPLAIGSLWKLFFGNYSFLAMKRSHVAITCSWWKDASKSRRSWD